MAQGGRLNATTWFDRTNYFETVPTGAVELALWLEADRHGHLLDAVTQENLDNQRDVVKEEKRQRYDNQPYGNALIDVYAAVFPEGHPYHHPTIGSMEDLDAASLDDVHAFFRAHYGPDNTVITLCGDLTPEHGFELSSATSATCSPGRRRAGPTTHSFPLGHPVRVDRHEDVPNDRLHVAFRLPVDETDEFLAAAVALDCIGGLATSRLVRRLVRREQTALGAHATAWGFVDGASLGFVVLDVAPGTDADIVESPFVEELNGFLELRPHRGRARGLAGPVRAVLALGARQPGGARRPDQPPPAAARRPGRRQHAPRPVARRHGAAGARRGASLAASRQPRHGRLPGRRRAARTPVPPGPRRWHERFPTRGHAAAALDLPGAASSTCSTTACGCWRTTCPASTCCPCASWCPLPCPTSHRARRGSAR